MCGSTNIVPYLQLFKATMSFPRVTQFVCRYYIWHAHTLKKLSETESKELYNLAKKDWASVKWQLSAR